jgi:hypothetical protein
MKTAVTVLTLFLVPGPGELVDLDEDGGELPPELEDPGRPFRRLIQAILSGKLAGLRREPG